MFSNRAKLNRNAIWISAVSGLTATGIVAIVEGSDDDRGGNDTVLITGIVGAFIIAVTALFQNETTSAAYVCAAKIVGDLKDKALEQTPTKTPSQLVEASEKIKPFIREAVDSGDASKVCDNAILRGKLNIP